MPAKRTKKRKTTKNGPVTRPGQHSRTTPAPPPAKKEGELIGNLYDNMDEDTVVVVHRFDPESGRQVLMYKLMPDEATDIEDRWTSQRRRDDRERYRLATPPDLAARSAAYP